MRHPNLVPQPDRLPPAAVTRRTEIDGIRGWAALCVVLFHLIWEIFGAQHPEFRSPILHALLDGPLAVYVFFVLSGDALSIAFTDPNGRGTSPRMVLKRYFRLAGPILFSCFVAYLLMRFGMTYNKAAGDIVGRPDWLGAMIPFQPSFVGMLKYGSIDVFTNSSVQNSYNPFLWPMGIELAGSMLVFCLGIVYRALRDPVTAVFAGAAFLTLLGSPYALFLVGAWFGLLRSRGFFERVQERRILNRWLSLLAVAVLVAIELQNRNFNSYAPQARIVLASAVVLVCYSSGDLLAFMRSRISNYLGRISFPLYFMQFPVIVSWTSWCIVQGRTDPASIWASPISIVLTSLAVAIVAATITERLEARYLAYVDRIVARYVLLSPGLEEVRRLDDVRVGDVAL